MNFLLNLLFGVIGGGIALWVCQSFNMPVWMSRVIAVVVGILVFAADLAARVHAS